LTINKKWNFTFIFHGIAFGMLPTLIPLYFTSSLNGSLVDFGVMSAFATLFSILTSVYAGKLPQKYGKLKPFILISFLLSSIFLFALSNSKNIFLFQFFYILLGITNTIYTPSTRVLIAETHPKNDWNRMFAKHSLIVGFSNTFGLAICSFFVLSVGYGTLLSICAPLVFASFFAGFLIIEDPPLHVERWLNRIGRSIDDLESFSYWVSDMRSAVGFHLKPTVNSALFGVGTLIFILASSSAFSALPIFLNEVIGMPPELIFAVFFCRSFVGAISFIVVGKLIGKGNEENAIKFASIARTLLVIILLLMVFLSKLSPILVVLFLSAVTFSWSLYDVGSTTIIMNYSNESSTGIYDALGGIGSVVGGLLSGLIPAIFGFNILFILALVLFSISAIMFWKAMS